MKRVHNGWKSRGRKCIAACAAILILITGGGLNGAFAGTTDAVQAQPEAETSALDGAAVLLDEAPEDKLCIGLLPTEAGGRMKYYVPDDATAGTLYERIKNLDAKKLKSTEMPPEWARTAWDYNIVVKNGEYTLQLCEGGVMRIDRTSKDYTEFEEWVARDQDVADYIMDVVSRDTGLSIFDASSIRDIVKAELAPGPLSGGEVKESIVLTDADKLAEIEKLLSNAEKSFWSKCPFGNCKLVLTTAAGQEIALAMACDSCTSFYADGCFFDYMPEEYRGEDEHPDNNVLFNLFGITAEYFI